MVSRSIIQKFCDVSTRGEGVVIDASLAFLPIKCNVIVLPCFDVLALFLAAVLRLAVGDYGTKGASTRKTYTPEACVNEELHESKGKSLTRQSRSYR